MIDKKKLYSLLEIVEEKLIPKVDTYTLIYNLVTTVKDSKNKKRLLCTETTNHGIACQNMGRPWTKKTRKIGVLGADIEKFKKLNNL
jgi:hypothetical protein